MASANALDRFDSRYLFRAYTILLLANAVWFSVGFWVTRSAHPSVAAVMIFAAFAVLPFGWVGDSGLRSQAAGALSLGHLFILEIAQWQGATSRFTLVTAISMCVLLLMWAFPDDLWHPFGLWEVGGKESFSEVVSKTEVANEERTRLARDLHDSVKQQLYAILTAAATAQERLGGDESGAAEALHRVRTAAQQAGTELDAMTGSLKAPPFTDRGFAEALKTQCEVLGFRTGADVILETLPAHSIELLAPASRQTLFRIAQELISNVARHARPQNVAVTLKSSEDDIRGEFELTVQDDGIGFDPQLATKGDGLSNIRVRLQRVGDMSIKSAPGHGTSVSIRLFFNRARFDSAAQYGPWNLLITIAGLSGGGLLLSLHEPLAYVFLSFGVACGAYFMNWWHNRKDAAYASLRQRRNGGKLCLYTVLTFGLFYAARAAATAHTYSPEFDRRTGGLLAATGLLCAAALIRHLWNFVGNADPKERRV